MEVVSSTGPIVIYQEGHKIPANDYKINVTQKTDNLMKLQRKYV